MNKNASCKVRLMEAFEIQKNYQRHKQKLISIKTQNSKQKVSRVAHSNIDKINSFQIKKITADRSRETLKNKQIFNQNMALHKTLTKVYNRKSSFSRQLSRQESKRSFRSSSSSINNINIQNQRLYKKITTTKSSYTKYRQKYKPNQNSQLSSRQQMISLLQKQLGSKPQIFAATPKMKNTRYSKNIYRIRTSQK